MVTAYNLHGTMKKTDSYLDALAAEIRGPDIPADAFSVADLAARSGITLKAAYNQLSKRVLSGELCTVTGRRPGDQRRMAYFYPARK